MSVFSWTTTLATAAFFGAMSVALGAFAAHGLKHRLDDYAKAIWETATHYQMYHALALLVLAFFIKQSDDALLKWSALSFTLGILFFSGSLYVLALSQLRWLGAITPIGGIALLIAWGLLFVVAIRSAA